MERQTFENTQFFSGIKAKVIDRHFGIKTVDVMQADFEELYIVDPDGKRYDLKDIDSFVE